MVFTKRLREGVRRGTRDRPIHDRQIEVIDHQGLGRELREILGEEPIRKPARHTLDREGRLPAANEVHPERDVRAGDVSPEHVEAFVPVVEHLIVGAFKARARKLEGEHVVACVRADQLRGDVRRVRNSMRRRALVGAR